MLLSPGVDEPTYPSEPPAAVEPARRLRRLRELPAAVLRPREKLLRFGVQGMSHAELLAVLLGTGTRGCNVLALAEDLVAKYGAPGLPRLSLLEGTGNRGVGRVKGGQMLAAFELARRVLAPPADEPRVASPAEAYALVRDLRRARKEHLIALYLDAQNRLILRETVSIGSLNTTRTHPREVLQPAIVHSALAFILVHNHPSGSLDPSRDDVEFTRTISRAGELMGISLYDHLIVSHRGYVSLKEKGLL
ncbi:MAG TPA: DNA repair protein RadC [Candidatus Polarisedimenticolia bacterium]|nr:DNA repair protein RadC [Candidatus Polarisedimenticolia bacterium]